MSDEPSSSSIDGPSHDQRPVPSENHVQREEPLQSVAASSEPDRPLEPVQRTATLTSSKSRRFSLMRFRHASDSHLSRTAREHAAASVHIPPTPPLPSDVAASSPTPSIVTTGPDSERPAQARRGMSFALPGKNRSRSRAPNDALAGLTAGLAANRRSTLALQNQSRASIDVTPQARASTSHAAPPPYGDESTSALALPVSRASHSSRSDDRSSGEQHGVFASTTTTTTRTVSTTTTTTFFRLPRRKKEKPPLFPLPPRPSVSTLSGNGTPRLSTSTPQTGSPLYPTRLSAEPFEPPWPTSDGNTSPVQRLPNSSGHHRHDSNGSAIVGTLGRPSHGEEIGRVSNQTLLRHALDNDSLPPPGAPASTRTSISTSSRPSFGGLLQLARLRHSTESGLARFATGLGDPGTPSSMEPSPPPLVVPERQEGDTPAKYLARLEAVLHRSVLASVLSKSDDDFSRHVLRSYMRRFAFFEDPLDMAVRKMLMQVELPKETQQIDRTLQAFADRYHECNPGIFSSTEDAYFVAFSILILHTDVFNKNNKRKMQKADYIKNTQGSGGVATEVLNCFYDNIAYTPFIHVEDDLDPTGDRVFVPKGQKKGALKSTSSAPLRKMSTAPVDPYALIMDSKLEVLRPPLNDILVLDDPFDYHAGAAPMRPSELQKAFFRSGVIQILSSRSRPEAFRHQATITNPTDAQVGVVDLKVTKVGVLWRKDPKKKKTRSPWQEWGAILTGSQLYFFRNTTWVKNLIHQYETHQRSSKTSTPVIFKPPLEQFKPDFLVSMDDVVALVDTSYKKHKNAFVLARKSIFQEILLADNEAELQDWLGKLNFAATFRTAGVRVRGISQGDSSTSGGLASSAAESSASAGADQAPLPPQSPDENLTQQIHLARRQVMSQRVTEANQKLATTEESLEAQLRTARHFSLLAPIQNQSRQDLTEAADRLAITMRWTRIGRWRLKCHRDILVMDLDEDRSDAQQAPSSSADIPAESEAASGSREGPARSPFSRLSSRNSVIAGRNRSKSRPTTQPAGSKIFSMDDIFRSSSKSKTHKSKGSWELPPLDLDTSRPQTRLRQTSIASDQAPRSQSRDSSHQTVSKSRSGTGLEAEASAAAAAANAVRPRSDEHQLLVNAGILSANVEAPPESTSYDAGIRDSASGLSDRTAAPSTTEDGAGMSKVRQSFHRKLRSSYVPEYRGRKTRESAGSGTGTVTGVAAGSEDGASPTTTEPEGLARSSDRFTVRGKTASVVKFGSEWQGLLQDEKVKARRQTSSVSRAPATSVSTRSESVDETVSRPSLQISNAEKPVVEEVEEEERRSGSAPSSVAPVAPVAQDEVENADAASDVTVQSISDKAASLPQRSASPSDAVSDEKAPQASSVGSSDVDVEVA